MKFSLKELKGYQLLTFDNHTAFVKDILFDEETWTVRYLELEFEKNQFGQRIILPRIKIMQPANNVFYTDLNEEKILNAPTPDQDKPLARVYEEDLHKYYGLAKYWTYFPFVGTGTGQHYVPQRPEGSVNVAKDEALTSLRSYNQTLQYKLHGSDGNTGDIDDIIVDLSDWRLFYILVDISKWFIGSKKVLIPVKFIDDINYEHHEIKLKLSVETINNITEFKSGNSIEENYENILMEYFERIQI
jgi:hypothetical protein